MISRRIVVARLVFLSVVTGFATTIFLIEGVRCALTSGRASEVDSVTEIRERLGSYCTKTGQFPKSNVPSSGSDIGVLTDALGRPLHLSRGRQGLLIARPGRDGRYATPDDVVLDIGSVAGCPLDEGGR